MSTKEQLASDAAYESKTYKLNHRDVAIIVIALERLGNILDRRAVIPGLIEKGLDASDVDHAYEQL
jgi:hypothetical protein